MLWPCEAQCSEVREISVGGSHPLLSENLKRKMLYDEARSAGSLLSRSRHAQPA